MEFFYTIWIVAALITVYKVRKEYVLRSLTEEEMINEIKRRRWEVRSKQRSDDKVDQEMRQL